MKPLSFILREVKITSCLKRLEPPEKGASWERLTDLMRIVQETINYCYSQYGRNLVSLFGHESLSFLIAPIYFGD